MNRYEDWLIGNIPAEKDNFSVGDWNKISEMQTELIQAWIEDDYTNLINIFYERYVNSLNKRKLLTITLTGIDYILNIQKTSFSIEEIQEMYKPFDDHAKYKLRESFDRRMTGDKVDPSIIKYSNRDRCFQEIPDLKYAILVDALVRFYEHLKKMLKQNEEENIDKQPNKDILTTKQQLLIIFFLDKYKILNLKSIHEDMTKQSKILYGLINRNEENTYKYFRDMFSVKSSGEYFTKDNLKAILPFFSAADMSQIVNEIKEKLKKFE